MNYLLAIPVDKLEAAAGMAKQLNVGPGFAEDEVVLTGLPGPGGDDRLDIIESFPLKG